MPNPTFSTRLLTILLVTAAFNTAIAQTEPPHIPRQTLDPAELQLEDDLKTGITTQPAEETSTELLKNPRAYMSRFSARIELPRPLAGWDDAVQVQPGLGDAAGWLRDALTPAERLTVSPLFAALYEAKARAVKEQSVVFQDVPDATRFYDLQAIWEIQADSGSRPVLAVQGLFGRRPGTRGYDAEAAKADPALDYRPTTTWRWPREGAAPPNLIQASSDLQALLKEEYAIRGLPRKRNRQLEAALAQREQELQLFAKWHYLDSSTAPFLVLPQLFRQFAGQTAAPQIGDVALVIANGHAVPAIFGDELAEPLVGEFSPLIREALKIPDGDGQIQALILIFPGSRSAPEGPPPSPEEIREKVRQAARNLGAPENFLAPEPPPAATPEVPAAAPAPPQVP